MTADTAPALLVRSVVDTSAHAREWDNVVYGLGRELEGAGGDDPAPVGVQVVFVVDGPLVPVDFDGVQLGSVSRKARTIVMKAAIRGPAPPNGRAVVLGMLQVAVEKAEAVARRRRLTEALPEASAVVARVVAAGTG